LAEQEAVGVGQGAVDAIDVEACSVAGLVVWSAAAGQPRGSSGQGEAYQERQAK
jgi:hypothetical protein